MLTTVTSEVNKELAEKLDFHVVKSDHQMPSWLDRTSLVHFIYESMTPWHDTHGDISRGLDYAFSKEAGKGGFLVLLTIGEKLRGALLMLNTGMGGYVPENLLLFVCVDPKLRGMGIGSKIIKRAMSECNGAIKLHVDHDNPAKGLYERMGFINKYAEMRLAR